MRYLIFIEMLLLFCTDAYSIVLQGKVLLRFDDNTWDVGHVFENEAKRAHTFHFINTHTAPIAIEKVIVTCGCTVPSYSKKPVMPNEKGYITVTFDPKGRANKFSKSLRVICNGGKSVNHLRVTGFVEPVLEPDADFPYPLAFGISADQLVLSYGTIQQNVTSKTVEARLYNYSMKQAALSYRIENRSGCLNVDIPKVIMPQSVVIVKATAVAPKGFYGSFNDRIVLYVNGQRTQALEVYSTAVDDMRGVSILNGPKLKLSAHTFELGKLKPDIQISRTVRITNQGKSPLAVRKLECEENISTDISKEIILKPGETQDLKFVITPRKGSRLKADVKLVSNDPKSPVRMIRFAGEVME